MLHEMVMVAAAYKFKDMKGSHIATAITYGFKGQLKSWWDNFLTIQQKPDILNHSHKVNKEEDTAEVVIEDGHDVLIATISNHFISNHTKYQAATKSILIKLHCPSLTDYHYYKNVFPANVLKKEDGTQGIWKERFITSLWSKDSCQASTELCYRQYTFPHSYLWSPFWTH